MLRLTYGKDNLNCCKSPTSEGTMSPGSMKKKCLPKESLDENVVLQIEAAFNTLHQATDCKSLLKKYPTKKLLDALKYDFTDSGATLLEVIQSGVQNLDSKVGVYAPDLQAYKVFAPLFNPIIEEYHGGFKSTDRQPHSDLEGSHLEDFVDLDPEGAFICSTRIRCARSLTKFPFGPMMTENDYVQLEELLQRIFRYIQDPELQCVYCPWGSVSKETREKMIKDHLLFEEGNRFLKAANACKHWPKDCGAFHNREKTFLVWVNEEDHLRIISMRQGGNVGQVFDLLLRIGDG